MVNKTLLGGVIGFLLGGLVVSAAAMALDKNEDTNSGAQTSTIEHNAQQTNKLRALRGDDFDKAFIEEMIKHHEGAIDMAKLTEANAKHDEIKQLGRDIMSTQSMEIDMMQTWQGDWGYKTVPKSHNVHGM